MQRNYGLVENPCYITILFWVNFGVIENISDNIGSLTKEEFVRNLTGKSDVLETEKKVEEIFEEADVNGDGSMDFIEFFTKLPTILNLQK